MRREGLADRRTHNRLAEVITMLRHFGFKEVKHMIKFAEKKVRAYRPDELIVRGAWCVILLECRPLTAQPP
jgi:hypothetical protein